MLTSDFISEGFPVLKVSDTISQAKKIFKKTGWHCLPVVNNELFEGLLSIEIIQRWEDEHKLEELTHLLVTQAVLENDHIFSAINLSNHNLLEIVAVIDENRELVGVITIRNLLMAAASILSSAEPGGIIVLDLLPQDYSMSELSRIIESNDAYIKEINTYTSPIDKRLLVSIKVNRPDITDIIGTLKRYDYNIRYYFGENHSLDDIKSNYENLMKYLKL